MNIPQYIYSTNYEDLQRYLALLVQAMQQDLSNSGWQLPQLTNAQVALITGSTFTPVMRVGTQWVNTDINKIQFITQQAVFGITNALFETVTSA